MANDQTEMDQLRIRSKAKVELDYSESDPFPVKAGPGKIVKGSLVRLTGSRSYASGTSIANALGTMVTFSNFTRAMGDEGGSGIILGSKLTKNTQSITNVSFRIWLYQTEFGSSLNPSGEDGGPLQIRWRRRDDRIGYLDFLDFNAGFDCAESYAYVGLGQSILFSTRTNNIYGLVQTLTPYKAVSQEQLDFYLHVSSD